ncbi:SusC/RagA family TonB-linked outer membrane protein [Rufibacter latericius]|uniref:TonB-dependent receptor n=1 Tax=Rufibacter latericius TaxID=2487040 RepID=A0A3M9MTE7_9BACT|nr:TonB-dependent receptor [Rufibacter latericius]RNI28804.1 TonB-dependent receptor [Rufibacter latericius]
MKKKLPKEIGSGYGSQRQRRGEISRWLFLLSLCLLVSSLAFEAHAQGRTISGRVVSAQGEGLAGVTVLVKGTSNGVSTDASGNYSLSLGSGQENGTLVVSYIGFTSQEVPIAGQSTLNITLQPDEQTLNEVVVIGYQTVRKRDLTGAVSVVNPEESNRVVANSVAESIQGLTPGVTVRNSGAPGQAAVIEIRGAASFTDTNPLYVIDGMLSDANSTINTNDIESIQILKDASAAAIYGSRAANGVVIITTKQGQAGPARLNVTARFGVQQIAKRWDMMNSSEFAALQRQQFENSNRPVPPSIVNPVHDTDWQDEVMRIGNTQDYNATLSGGSESGTYLLSGSYFTNKGVLKGYDFNRGSFRVNTRGKKGRLTFGENLLLTNTNNDAPAEGNPFYDLPQMLPVLPIQGPEFVDPIYNPEGWAIGTNEARTYAWNALAVSNLWQRNSNFAKMVGNAFVDLKLADWVSYKFDAGLEVSFDHITTLRKIGRIQYQRPDVPSSIGENRSRFLNTKFDHTVNFNKDLGVHHIDGVVGFTTQHVTREETIASRDTLAFYDGQYFTTIGAATGTSSAGGGVPFEYRNYGYLGRVNYVYNDRYLFTFTGRVDQDSRFGEDYRTGFFPSFSAAWRISEEEFFQNDWVNDLKINASYGELGIVPFLTSWEFVGFANTAPRAIFGTGQTPVIGGYRARLTNPDIRWENRIVKNIGLDASFLNNRISLELNFYNSLSKDALLVDLPLAYYLGNLAGNPAVNAGSIRNTGFEIGATYRSTERDFKWDVSANATTINNEVESVGNRGEGRNYIQTGITRTQVGRSIGEWYVLRTDGIFQSQEEVNAHTNAAGVVIQPNSRPGDIRFKDINGDGQISDADRDFAGSPWPTLQTGAQFNASYKGLTFNAQLVGIFGNKLFNGVRQVLDSYQNTNFRSDVNPWRPDNTNTSDPRIGVSEGNPALTQNNVLGSDRWLSNGSYVRLRNIEVGYALPQTFSSRLNVQNARVFISGQNLLTITDYDGLDPDVVGNQDPNNSSLRIQERGFDAGNWPSNRIFSFGVQFGF